MNTISLDAGEVYDRGLANCDLLTPEERLVYLLLEVEICADMEGWDHFFTMEQVRYLGELKAGLEAVGDRASLSVIKDYERGLAAHGVPMEAEAVAAFLERQGDDYFDQDRDWREEYTALAETRWRRVKEYLRGQGLQLISTRY